MRVEKQGHSFYSKVSVSVLGSFRSVNLRIGIQVSHPLNVHHNKFMSASFKREVRKGLRSLSNQAIIHEARIRVVFYVFTCSRKGNQKCTLDKFSIITVNIVFHMIKVSSGSLHHLENSHHKDVHLLGRIMSVIFFAPEFGVTLKFDVLKVDVTIHCFHVTFGHCKRNQF